jgi:hypothetical protein
VLDLAARGALAEPELHPRPDQFIVYEHTRWNVIPFGTATSRPTPPPKLAPPPDLTAARGHMTVDDVLTFAAAHGDEHVLTFADTAIEASERTGDPRMLTASTLAGELIPTP